MTATIEDLTPRFVEFIPKYLEPGVLYISIEYATTAHKCACGCGEKVVLPLHPTNWKMTFDGVSVTMRPSVGNWGFPCRSHYLITANRIVWAGDWDEEKIQAGRHHGQAQKSDWYGRSGGSRNLTRAKASESNRSKGWLQRALDRLLGHDS